MSSLGVSPTDSTSSVEINDCMFCEHSLEVCKACDFDGREDNDAMMGYDAAPRAPLELPAYYKSPKDGSYLCKQHGNAGCKSCFGWKKQIQKLHKEGKKNNKKTDSGTNLY